MARRYGSHPLDGTCPICDDELGGGNQRTNPLVRWRGMWAHRGCAETERGE